MKKGLLLCFFVSTFLNAFTQTSLSGVINSYAAVTAIDSCTATLTLERTTGFTAGMDVILIQMQGAIINASNNANFGNISNLRSAGLYEKGRIRTVNANKIVLENALLHSYNADGNVQLISLPQYEDASVDDTLTAQPWDGRTGGVLAIQVMNTLTLNAPIEVSGMGFRGGIADIEATNNCSFLTNTDAYFYSSNNWRGAAKGEGIAAFLENQEAGRGAQATGGGGGNDHNAGGGGGANVAAGGNGGNNNEPNTFGCDGDFPGIGGKAPTDLNNRIFLGGGGGAGHENNDSGSNGGNGGGIVIIIAKNLQGNSFKIAANGMTPPITTGDGAGGGGAAGSIVLSINTVLSPFLIEAKGGDGGNIDNKGDERCHGPGGGGSGGVLSAPDTLPISYDLSRGKAGISINSGSCSGGTNGAQPGGDGFQKLLTNIPQSNENNAELAIISQPRSVPVCLNQSFSIPVILQGNSLQYQWQLDKGDGAGFQPITEGGNYTGTKTKELTVQRFLSGLENHRFRLQFTSSCAAVILQTEPISLTVQPASTSAFNFTVTGATFQFSNTSTNAEEFFWNFGDGNTSEETNPSHTYTQEGTYTVTLQSINACDTAVFTQNITVTGAPVAGFSANNRTGCQPLSVTFENTSSANATSFVWILPGATPNFSTQKNPSVTYTAPGTYGVTLIASNAAGIDTVQLDSFIVVKSLPNAQFTTITTDLLVVFANASTNSTSYLWNFGDEQTRTSTNPSHLYSKPGTYTVTLIATNECGSDTLTQIVKVATALQASFSANRASGCAPHLVNFSDASRGTYESRFWEFPGGNPSTSTEANPRVIYSAPGQYDVRLIIQNGTESDTIHQVAFINVLPSPLPAFSYTVNGLVVTFQNNSTNAQNFQWNFGNGQTSTQQNPVHNFGAPGVYTVTLNASNAYCGRSTSQTVAIGITSTDDLLQNGIQIAPNPTHNHLNINAEALNKNLQYRLYNVQGQLLQNGSFIGKTALDVSAFANGMYLLQLQNEDKIWVAKIVKQ